jgi:uncharacterized Zn ribbon protein
MARPKCFNKDCEREGWICVGGNFYCSICVTKWNEKQKDKLRREMEDAS